MDEPRGAPDRLVARLRAAGCVFAEEEARLLLGRFVGGDLDSAVARRCSGEPLEHVLGEAVFCGVPVAVRPPVFVPRRRAEPLAWAALAAVRTRPSGAVLLELGCGAAPVASVVASTVGSAEVWASDVSAAAVACARDNGTRHGFRVVAGDWWSGLPRSLCGRIDVVACYLPHVPRHRMQDVPADNQRAEQECALLGGEDGLDPLRAVLPGLGRWLRPDGDFCTLLAAEQVDAAGALAAAAGWACTSEAYDGSVVVWLRRTGGTSRPPGPLATPGPLRHGPAPRHGPAL